MSINTGNLNGKTFNLDRGNARLYCLKTINRTVVSMGKGKKSKQVKFRPVKSTSRLGAKSLVHLVSGGKTYSVRESESRTMPDTKGLTASLKADLKPSRKTTKILSLLERVLSTINKFSERQLVFAQEGVGGDCKGIIFSIAREVSDLADSATRPLHNALKYKTDADKEDVYKAAALIIYMKARVLVDAFLRTGGHPYAFQKVNGLDVPAHIFELVSAHRQLSSFFPGEKSAERNYLLYALAATFAFSDTRAKRSAYLAFYQHKLSSRPSDFSRTYSRSDCDRDTVYLATMLEEAEKLVAANSSTGMPLLFQSFFDSRAREAARLEDMLLDDRVKRADDGGVASAGAGRAMPFLEQQRAAASAASKAASKAAEPDDAAVAAPDSA